jgi:hypothetical protein
MLTPVDPPRVRIEVAACRPAASVGRWRVTWTVHNDSSDVLSLEEAWVPHGRFRGDGHVPVVAALAPGERYDLSLEVTSAEAPGTVVENAYLIVRAALGMTPVRLFARMRVVFDQHAQAQPAVETLTAQFVQSG